MRKKFRRSCSLAAKYSPRLGFLSILILIVTIICHRFGLIEAPIFFVAALISAVLAMVGLVLAIRGFVDLWERGDKGGRNSIKGVILSLLALTPFIIVGVLWLLLPSIYDVSSDIDNPPILPLASRSHGVLPFLEDFSEQVDRQMKAWPDLSERRYDSSPDRILKAVETVFEARGWPVQDRMNDADGTQILIAASAYMPILGFISDVIVRVRDEIEATQVDMRVTSRELTHDFGFGAYTIRKFMQDLDREVLLGSMEQVEDD